MSIDLDYQIALDDENALWLPSEQQCADWANLALGEGDDGEDDEDVELTIRIVDEQESQALNDQYRDKNKPTNILSFPFELPHGLDIEMNLLGDLVLCAPIVDAEAKEQQKALEAHWAHMVIHGTLHLLGYDHIDDEEAEEMEAIEIECLESLGITNPYEPVEQELEAN
jgi:probable rRNA maturation factor